MAHRAVYKTTAAEYLDRFYDGESRPLDQAFADALALMERGSLSDATRDLEEREDGALEDGSTATYESKWLSAEGEYGDQPVDRVLRHGYTTAVEVAQARGVPITNFWVTGASEEFEIHICEGTDRVAVFMFVPHAAERDYGSSRAASRSWVVRAGDIDVRPEAPRTTLEDGDLPILRIQVSGDLGE